MLDAQCQEYLKSRGYTDPLITQEGWFTCGPGTFTQYGLQVTFKESLLAVLCKTPTGRITALQTVNPRQKDYRRFRTEAGNYLPVYFASDGDFELWEVTGEVFLVEGIFDRIAVRRCGVRAGVFALLGLGMSVKMAVFLARHSKRVWLMLDKDEKGQVATERLTKVLKAQGAAVEAIDYPEKDPGEMYRKRGQVRMSRIIEQQIGMRGW